jgi:amino acid adenylation domain-containing protein
LKTSTEPYYLAPVDFDPFAGPELELIVPLAKAQEEIWLSCKLGGDDANRSYNESVSLKLNGLLNQQAMQLALQDLILRHQSLRSTIKSDGTQLLIHQNWPLNLVNSDLSNQNSSQQETSIQQFLEKEALEIYDLENGPLFRTTLFKLSAEKQYFTFSAHHIICDGWSLGILLQDLSKLYSAYLQNQQPQLPEVPQISLYITEQQEFEETQTYQQNKQFWVNKFTPEIPVTELPVDFPRPATRTYKSRRDDFLIGPELTSAIKKTGAKSGCSFVVTLLSAFEVLLHQITNQAEIVVGLPASGQAQFGYYGLTGHCVNLLPIKSVLKEASTFKHYLKQRKPEILDVLEHQQFNLGTLLKTLHFRRDPSRIPLVPIVFNMDMNMDDGVAFEGLTHQVYYNPRAYETFEIFLNASGSEKEITLEWSYNTQLFKPETICWMMESFKALLQVISAEPDVAINSISLPAKQLLSAELNNWNATDAISPRISLPEMISQSLKKHAVKTAISFYDTSITNGELLSKSNQFAALLTKKGIRKGDLVGVALDRSIEMVITFLAVLKAGAAYIPLDPTYPQERIHYMLQDSGAKLLVVNQKYQGQFLSAAEEMLLEEVIPKLDFYSAENPDLEINGSDLAYVLYTSGSTGRPKGVQIEHHNITNLLNSIHKWPGITADDKMLAISTVSFDIAGLELYLPLISGAEMVLADTKTAKDGFELLKIIQSAKISLLQATPATFRMLLETGWKDKLPVRIFCCGEALQPDLAKKLTALSAGLWNMYGPTETTIYSTGKQIFYEDELITIGHPIDNTRIYILDDHFNLLPEGEIGEIFIGGDGVARGYLNQAGLTATRFPKDIFSSKTGMKMYRTGDVARFLTNGEIEYLGRADHQVKIRGHRVELGEIEAQLLLEEQISQVVVIAREDQPGNQQLVAYVIAPTIKENNLKNWISIWKTDLKEVLPPFMIPAQFVVLSQFPLTPNNKIDRNALPKPQLPQVDLPVSGYIGPRTDVEKLVSDIWCSVLGLSTISIDDNFFEIGGHSLSAVQIMSRLEKETGQRLPLSSLFEASTIESLSLLLQMDGKSITWDSLVPIRPKGNKTPLYIVHGAGLNVLLFNTLASHMDPDQPVYGLQAKGLNGVDKPLDKLEAIAAHYIEEITRHNPNGPYALAGYSFGGTIAYEMAKQLQAMNKEVKVLALFDSYADQTPNAYPAPIRLLNKSWNYTCRLLYTFVLLAKNPVSTFRYKSTMVKRKLTELSWKLNPIKPKEQVGFFGYSHEIDKMNQKAAENYYLTPYNGKIDLFRAKVRTFYMDDPEYLGWKNYALKGVNVHEIPGDHNYIFAPPNDREFAEVLQNCLNQSA